MQQKQLVVVGGGAAGFFCAVNAARLNPHLKVSILEKGSKLLQKVKVSGGGRCNVTHACDSISAMSKCYPRGEKFVKKAFHHFFVKDTIEWFAARGVALKVEEDGRMFPVTDSSESIIHCLLQEANKHKVEIFMNHGVSAIERRASAWEVQAGTGRLFTADYLCIACGGFSRAEQFGWIVSGTGHSIAPPVPSLFTFNLPGNPITKLMGISVPHVLVKIAGTKIEAEGPLLITHWGLSGPAILRTSAFGAQELALANYRYRVMINWLPAYHETGIRDQMVQHRQAKGTQKLVNTPWISLPERLMLYLLEEAGINADARWTDIPAAAQNKLARVLCSYELHAEGKTTFKEEFVTAGGIELTDIDSATMRSRLQPNLYFAGEVVNVDGITGGYNFQFAWTSAYLGAQSLALAAGAGFSN